MLDQHDKPKTPEHDSPPLPRRPCGQQASCWKQSPAPHRGAQDRGAQDSPAEKPVASGLKRLGFFVAAGVFFVLGALGVLLPGLPATPFLLLTSYFLLKSSPRLNAMLLRSRLFGPILVDWQVHGGVRQHVKFKAIVAVVVAVAVTAFLSRLSWPVTLTVTLLAAVGISVILRLPKAG